MKKITYPLIILAIALLTACNSNPTYTGNSTGQMAFKSDNPDVMIMQGDIAGLKRYLNGVTDIDKKTDGNFTLLHKAAMFDKPDAAEVILMRGANPNSKGMIGVRPLFYIKNIKMLDLLIKHGADIHIKNDSGLSLLYFVNEPDVIRSLIDKGVDPNDQGAAGISAAEAAKNALKAYYDMDDNVKNNPAVAELIKNTKEKVRILEEHEKMPELLMFARKGDLAGVKKQSKKQSLLKTRNATGNTALHIAAQNNRLNIVKYLANNRALLQSKNNHGQSPLDLVVSGKSESAKYLSCKLNQHCSSVAAFDKKIAQACSAAGNLKKCQPVLKMDIHGVFAPASMAELVIKMRFNDSCKKFNYIECKQLQQSTDSQAYAQRIEGVLQNHTPSIEKKFESSCGIKGKKSTCRMFMKQYPGFKSKEQVDAAMAYLSQKCKIKEIGWVYKGSACKAGFAHGTGEAVNTAKQLSYIGKFQGGQRINGKINYNGQPMYDGLLKNGKPNGVGICFHEGEPEECKYYEGKRVDSLYKQRLELVKQQKVMDDKLAKLEQAQSAQLKQMQMQMQQAPAGAAQAKDFGDVLMEEGQRRVANKIFDSLF